MQTRTIHLPLRLIREKYGRDSHDIAGDDVVECLNLISDYPGQFTPRIAIDTSHENPWYHAMSVTVGPISEQAMEKLIELLRSRGHFDN